jgi:tripartite-type tricarboxylate transporter receptor subunit TctC
MKLTLILGAVTAVGLAVSMSSTPANADAISDFYKGKRMTMIVGLSPGGGYDRYARLTARYMRKYIPGKPTIITKNMTGGGSIVATNFIYGVAAQDGTIIGAIQRGIPMEPLTKGDKSLAKFDPLKIQWIGSANRETSIAIAWHTSGVKTIQDLFKKQLIVGGTGVTTDSVVTAHVMNNITGTKFKVIAGYPGGSEMDLAMERGETFGRATFSWSSFKTRRLDWLKKKQVYILFQMGAKKNNDPMLKDVPLALDFAKDERGRKILFLNFAVGEFGRPYMLGPKVPKPRVAALRVAFNQAMKDKSLIADATKSRITINPATGQEVAKLIADMYASSPDVIAGLRKAGEPSGKVEIVKIPIVTAKGKITKIQSKGRRVSFKGKADGKKAKKKLRVSGRRTKVTIGGKKAKRSKLKVGMSCTFVYKGSSAKKIACM